jgi:hypothetical protein
MKRENNLKEKLSSVIVLVTALLIFSIYLLDLKNDYYYHLTGKKTNANIQKIEKIHAYKPYIISLSYSNDNTRKVQECILKLDGRFGEKLNDEKIKTIEIFYTEQNPCDIYIKGYKNPTKAGLITHLIIFLISIFATVIFSKKLFSTPMNL